MPTATPSTLTTDQIDDLLYLARLGETTELRTAIDLFAKNLSTTPGIILAAAVDGDSGNGLLHMAAANGYTAATLKTLLPSLSSPSSSSSNNNYNALSLNLQNASGNTPLHWAALNGHLSAVKLLVEAGADTTVVNKAGRNAVYEAEASEKDEVAAWLLTEGKGVEGERVVQDGEEIRGEGEDDDDDGGGRLEEVMGEGDMKELP